MTFLKLVHKCLY